MNQVQFKGTKVDAASGYVVNRDVKLPAWVKCYVCGGPPKPADFLKPIDQTGRKLIHLSHINDGPKQSEEAGYIARNA